MDSKYRQIDGLAYQEMQIIAHVVEQSSDHGSQVNDMGRLVLGE